MVWITASATPISWMPMSDGWNRSSGMENRSMFIRITCQRHQCHSSNIRVHTSPYGNIQVNYHTLRGALVGCPYLGLDLNGGQTTEVCDAWPMRCQTYGYLPARRTLLPCAVLTGYWIYAAQWQRHTGVNNLPSVVTCQCNGRELNLQSLCHKSNTPWRDRRRRMLLIADNLFIAGARFARHADMTALYVCVIRQHVVANDRVARSLLSVQATCHRVALLSHLHRYV